MTDKTDTKATAMLEAAEAKGVLERMKNPQRISDRATEERLRISRSLKNNSVEVAHVTAIGR